MDRKRWHSEPVEESNATRTQVSTRFDALRLRSGGERNAASYHLNSNVLVTTCVGFLDGLGMTPLDVFSGKKESLIVNEVERAVWVVDPDRRSVTAYAPDRSARLLVEDEILTGGDVLPGFEMAMTDIFE